MIIGVTGTSCSGKHTFAEKLAKQSKGVVIDVDKLAHELYFPESELYTQIIETLGKEVLNPNNKTIDREKLGNIVFSDQSKLAELNKLMQEPLEKIVLEIMHQYDQKKPKIIVAALLKELNLRVDYLITVHCDLDIKKQRSLDRQISPEKLEKILQNQIENEDYDFFVQNNKETSELDKEAKRIWTEIKTEDDSYIKTT